LGALGQAVHQVFQKSDPNPQCWTSHCKFFFFHGLFGLLYVLPATNHLELLASSASSKIVKSVILTFLLRKSAFKKLILKDFLNSSKLRPRLPGAYRHKQEILQMATLFYIHCV
jgi:hypothetical protein